jgi:hypothetical protein
MKQEAKGKNIPNNILMSILVSAYGGYILPPTHIWQMLAWKKNRRLLKQPHDCPFTFLKP